MNTPDFLVIGGGIFGLTAVDELLTRGHTVTLLDQGPIPHPLAASTDISKVVRMEYGTDDLYFEMVDRAIDGWHAWNEQFQTTLYHETGVTMLARQEMAPGGYEYESYQRLLAHGYTPERLRSAEIRRRFPAWQSETYPDGFFNPRAGFAESGRVVAALAEAVRQRGATILAGHTAVSLLTDGQQVHGIRTATGETFTAGHVIIAAGAWTHILLPELQPYMKATGHPVFHLRPANPELFTPPNFVVFTAAVAQTGWYGFPLHPHEGVVKIANHGVGQILHPTQDERLVTAVDEANLRHFLRESLPALADAPIVYTRRCLYNDTRDEHFWLDRHPSLGNLTVAAGGSGHGFKFAPVLGQLIADTAVGNPHPWLPRFRWRDIAQLTHGQEAARYHGD